MRRCLCRLCQSAVLKQHLWQSAWTRKWQQLSPVYNVQQKYQRLFLSHFDLMYVPQLLMRGSSFAQ
jgi:hypothetical protein